MKRVAIFAAGFFVALSVLGQPQPRPQQTGTASGATLYQRLGGYDAIAAVTDEFITRMVLDKQLGRFFVGMSKGTKTVLREHIVEFLCDLTGGPCHYIGKDLKPAHEGLGITESDWRLAVAHLVASLNKFNVAPRERDDFVNAIAVFKDDIVEKH